MLGDVNKLFVFKSLFTTPINVLHSHLKQTFPPIIWIFTEGEGDRIESRLPFRIFSTLQKVQEFSRINYKIPCESTTRIPWQPQHAVILKYFNTKEQELSNFAFQSFLIFIGAKNKKICFWNNLIYQILFTWFKAPW